MKMSKTTLKELSAKYRAVLKKCFLINLGILLTVSTANAKIIDSDQNWDAQQAHTALHQKGNITISENKKVNITSNKEATNTYNNLNSLTLGEDSTFKVETTGGDVKEGYDFPSYGQVFFKINQLTVNKGANLSLSADKDHTSDISDVKTAILKGNITLHNSRIEGDMDEESDTITLDGAKVTMTGDYANMESGQVTITNSTINANVLDHGFVSTKDFAVTDSTINLNRESHLVSIEGKLDLENSSITLGGGDKDYPGSFLYGDSMLLNGTSLTTNGLNYIFTTEVGGIDLINSKDKENLIEVNKGSILSVFELDNSISLMDDNFDEGHDTVSNIINNETNGGFSEALGTHVGKLTIKDGTNLNVHGELDSDVDIQGGNVYIDSGRGIISTGANGINISGGKVTAKNGVDFEGEIHMGKNLLADKDINITGGEVKFEF